MSSFGFRPHFDQKLDLPVKEAEARIMEQLQATASNCEVKRFPGFICLRIPEEDRHFWSPRLTLSIDADDDGNTIVTGTYGPNANVWSLFFYGYLIVGSIALFSGILSWVQHTLGHNNWSLWIFIGSVIAAVGLYILAQLGQKLGASQTYRLHHTYENAMGPSGEVH